MNSIKLTVRVKVNYYMYSDNTKFSNCVYTHW